MHIVSSDTFFIASYTSNNFLFAAHGNRSLFEALDSHYMVGNSHKVCTPHYGAVGSIEPILTEYVLR
jgi:hypothetical protein